MKFQPNKHWPWLAGYFLMVNIYLVPSLANSPRLTDVGGLILAVWILYRLATGRQEVGPLVTAGFVALVPLIWLFFSLLKGESTTGVQAARWLLAIPWALGLAMLIKDEEKQVQFAWGIVIGGLVNTMVILMQWQGMEAYLQIFGLSSVGANYHSYVGHTLRIPGLHGQHNASASVISLIIPAGFYLYFKTRMRLSYLLGVLFATMISVHLTSTRGPIIATVMTIALVFPLARRFARSIVMGFILASILVPLVAVYGPPGGWARWKNTEALVSNASERTSSTLGAITISIANPLGLGAEKGRIELAKKTGIVATHNAFIQSALVFGLPFASLLICGFLVIISRSLGGVDSPFFLAGLMAFHTAGLFMFEEHLNNPTFIITAAWLMVAASISSFRPEKSLAD